MDDNPAEREIVRRELAGVSVPELTAPEEYIKAIDRMGYFEVTLLSADDRKRAEMYKQNQQRAVLEQSFGNYEDYLHSLEMVCDIGAFSLPTPNALPNLSTRPTSSTLPLAATLPPR